MAHQGQRINPTSIYVGHTIVEQFPEHVSNDSLERKLRLDSVTIEYDIMMTQKILVTRISNTGSSITGLMKIEITYKCAVRTPNEGDCLLFPA